MFFFTLLVYGAILNDDNRSEINKISDFFNCLAAFEKIKEENPYLLELIVNSRNKRKIGQIIFEYINFDKTKRQGLIEEFGKIIKDYSSNEQLSFIPECLLGFLEYVISKRNDDVIRNLCHLIWIIKEGNHTTLLPYLALNQISSYLDDGDLKSVNLAYLDDMRSNFNESKIEEVIEFEQCEKRANALAKELAQLTNLTSLNLGSNSIGAEGAKAEIKITNSAINSPVVDNNIQRQTLKRVIYITMIILHL